MNSVTEEIENDKKLMQEIQTFLTTIIKMTADQQEGTRHIHQIAKVNTNYFIIHLILSINPEFASHKRNLYI
jgi:hypothetical protein